MKVFVDSSAWLALHIANDQYFKEAEKYAHSLIDKRALFFTNDYVLDETYTRLIYDFNLQTAQEFHKKIILGVKENLVVLEIDEYERELAWFYLEKFKDHNLSLTDATIVVNFNEANLNEIFTFDRHFRDINLSTNLTR